VPPTSRRPAFSPASSAARSGARTTISDDGRLPTVPDDRVRAAGFAPVETRHRTRFELPTATIREHTRLYADTALHGRTVAAGGPDEPLRFFFASALSFDPPLAPVVGVASMRPTVAREARRSFAADLRDRGVTGVERARAERFRTDADDRVRATGYRGTVAVGEETVAAAGWVGVWTTGGDFRLAGGGYPEERVERVGYDPGGARETLFDLLRAVR
jgi:hypothetical protein